MQITWPAGIDEESFLRDYWQKKPLLIKSAFPDFFSPLSPDELGGLALEDDIHSRLILRESDTIWRIENGPFSEEALTSLPSTDWSMLVSDIEKHLDGFHSYLEPYRFIPDWRIDDLMISYAPKGASVGPHIDQYDVFLFQAAGHRDWSIGEAIEEPEILPGIDLSILKHLDVTERWLLAPGDLLYLPPGIPHHGVSADNDCMTWSIGFRAPAFAELMGDISTELVRQIGDDDRYSDPELKGQSHPGEISADAVTRIRHLWQMLSSTNNPQFEQIIGRVLTQRSQLFPADSSSTDTATKDINLALQSELIVRDAASRASFIIQGEDTATLFVDGHHYPVSLELAKALCSGFQYQNAGLAYFTNQPQDHTCLLELWRQGILSVLEP